MTKTKSVVAALATGVLAFGIALAAATPASANETRDYGSRYWRNYTFYSNVKNSSGQSQSTYNYFPSAYIFCDL